MGDLTNIEGPNDFVGKTAVITKAGHPHAGERGAFNGVVLSTGQFELELENCAHGTRAAGVDLLDVQIDGEPVKRAGQSSEGQSSEGQGDPGGRPSTYTQDLADEICAQLAEGKSLRSVLKSSDTMPAMSTVFLWLRSNDEFSEQYARAKAESADALADDIQDIADGVLNDKYEPHAARVAMDGKKWIASKLKPKVYGDKLDLTTGNEKLNRGMSDAELNAILDRAAAGSTPGKAGQGTKAR